MSAIEVARFGLEDTALVARYDRLFAATPGAYIQQSTRWARAIRDIGPDRPIFLLASAGGRDIAGLPLYLFAAEPGAILTSVPQAGPLGGIFAASDLDEAMRDATYAALLSQAQGVAREHDCLALTLITDPFAADIARYERHLAPEFVLENFTQAIALDRIFDGPHIVLTDYRRRSGLSRALKAGREAGLSVRASGSEADFNAWYAVHEKRHGELGATPLPRDLLRNLLAELEPHGEAKLWLVERAGALAGGCLFVRHRDVLDAFIMSMDTAFADLGPNYALTDHALKWARGLGTRWFNWQSSAARSGGVYAFKARWGAEEHIYHFVTKVFCPPERLAALGPDGIKRHYPGHFVLPFGAFADGCRGGRYRKD